MKRILSVKYFCLAEVQTGALKLDRQRFYHFSLSYLLNLVVKITSLG